MRLAFIILTLISLVSCKERLKKEVNTNNREIEKVLFDSTYYNQLNRAYTENDTSILKEFFKNWHDLSVDKTQNSNQIGTILESIFNEVYYPFTLEKYGWSARPHYSKYKYAILPTEIGFKIVENFDFLKQGDVFIMYSMDLDTLNQFFPTPEIGNAKILYDLEPFKTSMQLFLKENSYQKSLFLGSSKFINIPLSNDWTEYLTSPEILGILLNKQKDSAVVDLRLISTGIRIFLTKKTSDWKKNEVIQLWIE